jgi:hypothetical protein
MKVFKNLQDFNPKKFLLEMNILELFHINKLSTMEKQLKVFGTSYLIGKMMDA